MRVTLLYREKDWTKEKSYFDREEICKDLNLHILFRAAASLYNEEREEGKTVKRSAERDEHISEMVKRVLMIPLSTPEEIRYRQQIIREAVTGYRHTEALYYASKEAAEDIARFAEARKKQRYGGGATQGRMHVVNIEYLDRMITHINRVNGVLADWAPELVTEEMKDFVNTFFAEYSPEFRTELFRVTEDMRASLSEGIVELAASLGPGLCMSSMVLSDIRIVKKEKKGFLQNAAGKVEEFCKSLFTSEELTLEGEKQNLLQDIEEIKNGVLGAMMQYFEPFLEEQEVFFKQLYSQVAFLMGVTNLYRRLRGMNVDTCFPTVADQRTICFDGLVEMSLAINLLHCPVDNSLQAEDMSLLVVTGANQGGKSTYLRSIAIAQVMLQCGMFVSAKSFVSGLYGRVFTHFTRREDSAMNSGRLDEELGRMERIIEHLTPDSVLFLNESFATTTEKEGSVIAEDITRALYERGIRVMMVTHLMAFAQSCYAKKLPGAVFLSAERKADGERTFRMVKQEPELTSYGLDLYEDVLRKKH